MGGAGSAEAGAERQGELEDNNEPRAGGGQAGGCVRVGEGGGVKGGWGLGSIASVGASFGKRLLDALPDD